MRSIENAKNISSSPAIRSTAELARQLGLSRWTVSRVINGHDGVHEDTVKRVRDAMRDSGFSPNPLAQGLRRGRTNIIGVCVPEIEDFYLGPKLEFLRRTVSEQGFHLMIGMTDGNPDTEIETLDHLRLLCVAGIISFASQLSPRNSAIARLQEAKIPLLLVDPMTPGTECGLGVDRASGMKEATRHLLDLGHRRFATLGFNSGSVYSCLRLAAIQEVLHSSKPKTKAMLQHLPLPEGDSLYTAGREAAEAFRREKGKDLPTAVLTINDRVAMGLIDGLRTLGLRVPEDISIIGYDNMEAGAFISPKLTTIDPSPDALMAQTATRLLRLIRNEGDSPDFPFRSPSRLIVRESTCKHPASLSRVRRST